MEGIIKCFIIEKLFNKFNVKIDFDNKVIIVVGENGMGKTTIINALYYTLSTDFERLKEIDFEKIVVKFSSGKEAQIHRKAILNWAIRREPIEIVRLRRYLKANEFEELMELIDKEKEIDGTKFESLLYKYDISKPSLEYYRSFRKKSNGESLGLAEAERIIKDEMNESKILFLPTYRRVEADIYRLNLPMEITNKFLLNNMEGNIKFGMKDVESQIEKVLNDIRLTSRTQFSKISADILEDFAKGYNMNNAKIENKDKLSIVFDRIGDNISEENKLIIKKKIKEGSFEGKNNSEYKYFLSKLIKIHENQKENEEVIESFKNTCNDYLINKEFVYDESAVTLKLYEKDTERKIDLGYLSSGEKQMVSLFTEIYLGNSKQLIVLMDEPELSLSIEWQQKLLPDVIKSNNCNLLFAVTHSPFIFKNELINNTIGLDMFMEEIPHEE